MRRPNEKQGQKERKDIADMTERRRVKRRIMGLRTWIRRWGGVCPHTGLSVAEDVCYIDLLAGGV